jgi:hypothetical protein
MIFGQPKIRNLNSQWQNTNYLVFINAMTVSRKMPAKMTPRFGKQSIHFNRIYVIGPKFFVNDMMFRVIHCFAAP